MKFILIVTICSGISNLCSKPMEANPPFDSYRECAIYGYEMSGQYLYNLNEDKMNNERTFVKFWCKEYPNI